MAKRRQADDGRLSERTKEWAGGWCAGVPDGIASSVLLLKDEHPIAALILVEDGLRRFPERFAEELSSRKIDVATLGIGREGQ